MHKNNALQKVYVLFLMILKYAFNVFANLKIKNIYINSINLEFNVVKI